MGLAVSTLPVPESAKPYAAFIITFNRPEILRASILKIAGQTYPPDLILIVDNGNSPETQAMVASLTDLSIEYAGLPENTGPAGGAHYGLGVLIERGYDWIYWGDDDDPPRHPDTLERLARIAMESPQQQLAAVGEVGQRFDWRKGVVQRLNDAELCGTVEVDVIAGGQQLFLNSAALRAVGLPRKDFFFSYEDFELCLRLRRAGWTLVVDGERMKAARISAGRYGVKVESSAINRPRESLWRHYYSTRNAINMMRTSFSRHDLANRHAMKEIIKSALSFKRGWRYGIAFAHMSLLGVIHGYTRRMGRTIEPTAK